MTNGGRKDILQNLSSWRGENMTHCLAYTKEMKMNENRGGGGGCPDVVVFTSKLRLS